MVFSSNDGERLPQMKVISVGLSNQMKNNLIKKILDLGSKTPTIRYTCQTQRGGWMGSLNGNNNLNV